MKIKKFSGFALILFLCVVFCFALFYIWSLCVFGSVFHGLAYLNNKSIIAEPQLLEFGQLPLGSSKKAHFTLYNLTSKPIRIIGVEKDCECGDISPLPLDIPPRQHRDIDLVLIFQQKDYIGKEIVRDVLLIFDTDIAPVILRSKCLICPPSEPHKQ